MTIKILPDLSRATLQRRARLHLILDLAQEQGSTYRWGYPLTVTFQRASASFTIRTPTDLADLFAFHDVVPIQVPNWLRLLPSSMGRFGPSGPRGPSQTCGHKGDPVNLKCCKH